MIHKNLYKLFLKTVSLAFVLIIITFLISCKKIEREAKVITEAVSEITTTTAKPRGEIIDLGSGITDYGHCWSLSANPTIADSKTSLGSIRNTGIFTSDLQNLEPGKMYHVRAYVKSGSTTVYGTEVSFTTSAIAVPTLTTTAVTYITASSAISGGNITSDGRSIVTARGVCWSLSQSPSISDNKTSDGTGPGSFTSNITGLTANIIYYARAYATNSIGTAYGNDVSFTTSPVVVPTLTTTDVTSITSTTAVSGGHIIYDGGGNITAKGVCWNTTGTPTSSDNKTTDGSGTGSFVSNLSGFILNTTYYLRAYATNSAGVGYGNQFKFTCLNPIVHYPLNSNAIDITGNYPDMVLINTPFMNNGIYCNGIYSLPVGSVNSCNAYTPDISQISYDSLTFYSEFMVEINNFINPIIVAGAGVNHDRWLGFSILSNGHFSLNANNFSLIAESYDTCSTNVWHTAAITYNSITSLGKLFIDGLPVCEGTFVIDKMYAEKSIGITNFSNGTTFKGYIRNITIYNGIVIH